MEDQALTELVHAPPVVESVSVGPLDEALRRPIDLFRTAPLFVKVRPAVAHSEISKPEHEYTVWLARSKKDYPDWLIIDNGGKLNPTRLEGCFEPVNEIETIDQ